MIVVNPRNHLYTYNEIFLLCLKSGEKCHFQGAVWDFHNFGLCNFFLALFSGDPTVESERSRKVGLYKVPLVFRYNQPELRYFDRPK